MTPVLLFLLVIFSIPAFAQQEHIPTFKLQAEIDNLAARKPNLTDTRPDAIMQCAYNRPYRLMFEAQPATAKGGDSLNSKGAVPVLWINPACIPTWPILPQARNIDVWPLIIRKSSFLPPDWLILWPGGDYLDRKLGPRGWVKEVKVGRHYIYYLWLDYSVLSGQRPVD